MAASTARIPVDFRATAILGKSLEIFWQNFARFFWITALLRLPVAAIIAVVLFIALGRTATVLAGTHHAALAAGLMGGAANIWFIVDYLVSMMILGLLQYMSFQSLRGQRMTAGAALRKVVRRLLPIAMVAVITGILVFVGMMIFFIPGLLIFLGLSVGIPACLIEGRGIFASLGRSWRLTRGHRGTIFLVGVLYYLGLFGCSMAVMFGLAAITMVVGGIAPLLIMAGSAKVVALPFMALLGVLMLLALFVVVFFMSVAAVAIQGPIFAVIYYYLRVIKDGADIDQIASVFD